MQCGPRGLKGAGDSLFHNNGDGTFTEVSRQAGVSDPPGYYGMGVIWSDLDRRGSLDLYIAVMTHWRPGRKWFAANTPKLDAIAQATAADPKVAAVLERNFS